MSDELEEQVVTGTFIRRTEGFTPASPVQEISKEEFDAFAPNTVADFLTQLPYSFNTTFTVGRAVGSSNGSGSLNLRNLGSDATLVLLNSRRVARDAVTVGNVDVNSLVPQIAIERIDVLKDGASSLYGSDAVGGVANFLTRRSFEGVEVQAQGDMRDFGNTTDYRVSGIWGTQTEDSGIVGVVRALQPLALHVGDLRDHPRPAGHRWRVPALGLARALLAAEPQRGRRNRRRCNDHRRSAVRAVRALCQHHRCAGDAARA